MQASPLKRKGRRILKFRGGDRVAFAAGILLTVLLTSFFSWRMFGNVTRDRALVPVSTSVIVPARP